MKLSRRSFMKANAVAAAAAAAGLNVPGVARARCWSAGKRPRGIKRRAVSAVLVAAFWSGTLKGRQWWPVRATRTHRLTVV